MRGTTLIIALTSFLLSLSGIVFAQEDIQKVPNCIHCGSNRSPGAT